MFELLILLSFLALCTIGVSLIGLVVQLFRRRPVHPWVKAIGVSFVVFIAAFLLAAIVNPTRTTVSTTQTTTTKPSTAAKIRATTTQ
jgi:hypothetical protein